MEEFRKEGLGWKWKEKGEKGDEVKSHEVVREVWVRKHIFRCVLFPGRGGKLSSLQELGK